MLLRAAPRQVRRQRFALEPLAHQVRDHHARARHERRAARDRLRDVKVAAREAIVNAARLVEPVDERARERAVERLGKVQALDRDRRVDAEVMSLVDDAEVALAGEGIDAKLSVEHIAYEVERIPVHASLLFCRRRAHESPEL